jgi:hypothetical protein
MVKPVLLAEAPTILIPVVADDVNVLSDTSVYAACRCWTRLAIIKIRSKIRGRHEGRNFDFEPSTC